MASEDESDDDSDDEDDPPPVPPVVGRVRAKSDETRTIKCQLKSITRNQTHLQTIEETVLRVHRCTILATELLNLDLRRRLEAGMPVDFFFKDSNVKQAWMAVSTSKGRVDPHLQASRVEQKRLHGAHGQEVDGSKLDQIFSFEARSFVATATTNLWFHLRKRVRAYVNCRMSLERDVYAALTKDERLTHKTSKFQVTWDVCKTGTEPYKTTAHTDARRLVDELRQMLGFDVLLTDSKPLEYHAKAAPHRVLPATVKLLQELKANGWRGFSLLPLRQSLKPKYTTIDTRALRNLFGLKEPEASKKFKETNKTKRQRLADDDPAKYKRAPKRSKQELADEQWEVWDSVFELSKALRNNLVGNQATNRRGLLFDFCMKTDGVGVSLCFSIPKRPDQGAFQLTELPKRGMWCIDQLKHLFSHGPPPVLTLDLSPIEMSRELLSSRLSSLQILGVDPGKAELAVAVDPIRDTTGSKIRAVRYTAVQRRFETAPNRVVLRRRQELLNPEKSATWRAHMATAAKEHAEKVLKPGKVLELERAIGNDSKVVGVAAFGAYVESRAKVLPVLLAHYQQEHHRKLRFRATRETWRSVDRFIQKLKDKSVPDKQQVVAWGTWGITAGRPGQVTNRGHAPCIGAGLAKRVAKQMLVVKTPEHMTSQTCCRCGGHCGRHRTVEANRLKDHPGPRRHEIRGLRLCEHSGCRRPLNRDKNAAVNIGTNLALQLSGLPPFKVMTAAEAELTTLSAAEPSEGD